MNFHPFCVKKQSDWHSDLRLFTCKVAFKCGKLKYHNNRPAWIKLTRHRCLSMNNCRDTTDEHAQALFACLCMLVANCTAIFVCSMCQWTDYGRSVRMPSDSKTISGLHPRFRSHCRLSPEKQASPPWLLSLCLQFIMHCLLLKNNPWPSLHIDFYQPAGPMIDLPCKSIDFPRSPS